MMSGSNSPEYWNSVWKKEGVNTWRQYPQTFQKVLEELDKIGAELRVLELGCGVGVLGKKILEKGHSYVGIDISSDAVEIAKKNGVWAYCQEVPPINNDFEFLGYKKVIDFDVVVATEFLEHFEDKKLHELLWEICRISDNAIFCVPNGILGPDECKEHHQKFTAPMFKYGVLLNYYEEVNIETFTDKFKTPNGEIMALGTIMATCKKVRR